VHSEDESVTTSSILQSTCESFLKLDSKIKGPRGESSIQCRGHQATRYMSHLLQVWFVLPEKQSSREDCLGQFYSLGLSGVLWHYI
jgi:hypothetical protein